MFSNKFLDTFHFSNGLISDKDEHPLNIYPKSVHCDTFHFSNGLISDIDEHPPNINSKLNILNSIR